MGIDIKRMSRELGMSPDELGVELEIYEEGSYFEKEISKAESAEEFKSLLEIIPSDFESGMNCWRRWSDKAKTFEEFKEILSLMKVYDYKDLCTEPFQKLYDEIFEKLLGKVSTFGETIYFLRESHRYSRMEKVALMKLLDKAKTTEELLSLIDSHYYENSPEFLEKARNKCNFIWRDSLSSTETFQEILDIFETITRFSEVWYEALDKLADNAKTSEHVEIVWEQASRSSEVRKRILWKLSQLYLNS